MTLDEFSKIKVGDIIYSFVDKNFYIYKVAHKGIDDITVRVEVKNNIPDGYSYIIINVPKSQEYNDPRYCYEFTSMSQDLNTAYQNYSEGINRKIRQLNGIRANLKGIKRQYMLNNDMIPEHEKTWKELGYKSKEDYQEHMNDLYDDIRHGYIG